MGYTTDFRGKVRIQPPLNADEVAYLTKFAETRRMSRRSGPYYVDGSGVWGQGDDPDVIDYNRPDPTQPGLWCQWIPTANGTALKWDGGEKFYDAEEWMSYLIAHFLAPDALAKVAHPKQFAFLQGHTCNGKIEAQGEAWDDHWLLIVRDNTVTRQDIAPVLSPDEAEEGDEGGDEDGN